MICINICLLAEVRDWSFNQDHLLQAYKSFADPSTRLIVEERGMAKYYEYATHSHHLVIGMYIKVDWDSDYGLGAQLKNASEKEGKAAGAQTIGRVRELMAE